MKKIYTSAALLLTFHVFYSQGSGSSAGFAPNIFPPKASVMPAFRMEQIPVSLSTGIPDISHQLLSVPIDDKLSYTFSVSYHPSQLRVEETGAELGVGWSASNLGIITRTVNGLNDDKSLWGILDNQILMPGNNFDGTINAGSGDWLKKRVYESVYSGQYDLMSDEYMFSFPGGSGKFFFVYEDGAIRPRILGPEKNFKIQYERDAAHKHLSSFTITDDKGYRYIFDLYESDVNIPVSTSVSQIAQSSGIPLLPQTEYKNNWHLTRIQNPSGRELLSADYQMYSFPDSEIRSTEYNYITDQNVRDHYKYKILQLNELDYLQPLYKTDIMTKKNSTYKLRQVTIAGRAVISYDKAGLGGQDFLDRVTLSDASGHTVSSYKFNVSPSGPKYVLSGIVNEQDPAFSYSFHYNGILIDAASKEKDHWGYYNGNMYTGSFEVEQSMEYPSGADKNTDPLAVLSGSLRYEVVPSKGAVEYVWEPNTFSAIATGSIGSYDIPENRASSPAIFTKTAFNNQPADEIIYVNTPQKVTVNFNAAQYAYPEDIKKYTLQITPVKYDQPFDPEVFTPAPSACYEETSSNTGGTVRGKQYLTISSGISAQAVFFGQGLYKVSLIPASQDLQYGQVQYTIGIYKYKLTDTGKYLYGGGLRIKQINFWNSAAQMTAGLPAQPGRFFRYIYDDFTDASKSGGVLNNRPVYSYLRTVNESENKLCPGGTSGAYDKLTVSYGAVQYKTYANNALVQAANLNGSFVTYSGVKVIDSEGYTQSYFTTPLDYGNDYDPLNYNYPFLPSRNPEKKYGLLKKAEVYNSSGALQKREQYDYTILEPDLFIGGKAYVPGDGGCFVKNSAYSGFLNTYEGYLSIAGNHHFNAGGVCGLFGGCGSLDSVLDSKPVYKKNTVPLLQQKTVTDFYPSGSSVQSVNYQYNSRYGISRETVLKADASVQETVYRYAPEKNNQKLIAANMLSIPLEVSLSRKETPSGPSSLVSETKTEYGDPGHFFPTSVSTYNYLTGTSEAQIAFNRYDSKGNLLQYTTKEGIPVAVIWGYGGTLPLARIEGAQYDDIKTNALVMAAIQASESDAQNPSTEQALISALDQLRDDAYFKDFRIMAYTYDPLVGPTSVTPPSGLRELYRYNAAGRLEKTTDEQGKTLQEFKYNYKN